MIKNNNRRNGNRNTHNRHNRHNARCDFLSNCWNGATVLSAFQWISSEISRQTKPNKTEPNKIRRSCTELNWAELKHTVSYHIVHGSIDLAKQVIIMFDYVKLFASMYNLSVFMQNLRQTVSLVIETKQMDRFALRQNTVLYVTWTSHYTRKHV